MEPSLQDFDFISLTKSQVKLDWEKLWSNYGHAFGEGMLSPGGEHFFINIPKNASCSIKETLTNLNWEFGNISDYPEAKVIVAVRDPVQRWISGISEYLMMYYPYELAQIVDQKFNCLPLLSQRLALSILFNKITFDDHTERQAMFLRKIKFNRCTWLKVDENLNKNLANLLTEIGYPIVESSIVNVNVNDDDSSIKKNLKDLIKLIVEKDDSKHQKLKEWFWCDYQLMEQIKFYD
jgi:hypothetical protein